MKTLIFLLVKRAGLSVLPSVRTKLAKFIGPMNLVAEDDEDEIPMNALLVELQLSQQNKKDIINLVAEESDSEIDTIFLEYKEEDMESEEESEEYTLLIKPKFL